MEIDNNRVFCINDYKYLLFRVDEGRWFIYLRNHGWFSGDTSLKNNQLRRVKNHGLTYLRESETSWYELSEDEFEREIRPLIKSDGQMSLFN